ncbi:hypothetical protein [Nocardioides jiangxiensis]|uniref:Uncharacterized protein n=1 Tax=Nocardioides jiangxiensis TaxID=3064524 RepID=A0ABT9AX48_9ACTN|nr:hypothetical protein [Nocardioides sp. WY-20]MDO7867095.1 hypothetical protein [Nocardioides sp. WY-20]
MNTIPVPLTLEEPSRYWQAVTPESVGVTSAEFVALRWVPEGEYTPTLTVGGAVRPADLPAEALADEALEAFRADGVTVSVVERKPFGAEGITGLMQLLDCVLPGTPDPLKAIQVIMSFATDKPDEQAIVVHTVTCTAEQFPTVRPEFASYISAVRLDQERLPQAPEGE